MPCQPRLTGTRQRQRTFGKPVLFWFLLSSWESSGSAFFSHARGRNTSDGSMEFCRRQPCSASPKKPLFFMRNSGWNSRSPGRRFRPMTSGSRHCAASTPRRSSAGTVTSTGSEDCGASRGDQNSRSCRFNVPNDPILATANATRNWFSLRVPIPKRLYCTLNPQQSVLYVTCVVVYCMIPCLKS